MTLTESLKCMNYELFKPSKNIKSEQVDGRVY
jgi:hypothetical protein